MNNKINYQENYFEGGWWGCRDPQKTQNQRDEIIVMLKVVTHQCIPPPNP